MVVVDSGIAGDAGVDQDVPAFINITILHTNDEHGWIQPTLSEDGTEELGGVANIYGMWRKFEGIEENPHVILSSGDNWSGAAISSWFDGEPAMMAMTAMGYHASALGNHEFDNGREALEEHLIANEFPYLGANVIESSTGATWELLQPYVILPVGGINLGVVGLLGEGAASAVQSNYLEGLEFADCEETLEAVVPEVRAAGADVVVVLAHLSATSLIQVEQNVSVEVDAYFGGHAHKAVTAMNEGIPLVETKGKWRGYHRVDLTVDSSTREVVDRSVEYVPVVREIDGSSHFGPDANLEALVEAWQQATEEALGVVIGYADVGIVKKSWPMANWVNDSWLWAFPDADVAINNPGSMRDSIPAGDFTAEHLINMLPFENEIYVVEVTGQELIDQIEPNLMNCGTLMPEKVCIAVSGIVYGDLPGGLVVTMSDGSPIAPEASYTTLVTDYIYYGGAGFDFMSLDPEPVQTGVTYDEPVLQWTTQLETSADDPIENHIDGTPRNSFELLEVIGHCLDGVSAWSWPVGNLVTDAMRTIEPEADFSLLPILGISWPIPAGDLHKGDIHTLYPFAEILYDVSVSGEELLSILEFLVDMCESCGGFMAVSGFTYSVEDAGAVAAFDAGGEPLDPGATYSVILTEYDYSGFADLMPTASYSSTGIDIRVPIVGWISDLGTTIADPLENHLDFTPRQVQ